MYEVDNCLALVRYDYAKVTAADCRAVVGQHVVCLSEGEELCNSTTRLKDANISFLFEGNFFF
jgi:hypothetical protein